MKTTARMSEFWTNDIITSLPMELRLLYLGLRCYTDENEEGLDSLALIIADLFPHDILKNPHSTIKMVTQGLEALVEKDLIRRFEKDGQKYITVYPVDEPML